MALNQGAFDGIGLVDRTIMRLREWCPPEGYYFADSGGKDSTVVRQLLIMSGVKYDGHYAQGGIDPPELVKFIRAYHPETVFERPPMSVWKGVMLYGMPRRQARWCCALIKEHQGGGRWVVTGIRWQESNRRRLRQMVETCKTDETKTYLHPIIDWTSADVWGFIRQENIPYCSLYDEGFKRLGCVLCPMNDHVEREMARWPKLADAWKRAAYRYWNESPHLGVKRWPTAEAMWQWWLSRKGMPRKEQQCFMLDN